MAGSFILVGRAQGRSERGVFDRPFTLPVLIIPAFPLSGVDTTYSTCHPPTPPPLPPSLPPSLARPPARSLSLRAVIIAIPVRRTSLLCVHDTALIEKHTHMHSHSSTHHTHPTHHGFTAVVPLVPPYTTPIPPSI